MFTMIGAAEKAGSGVDKIRMGWNSQHWRSPIIREQMKPDRILWKLPMMSLIPNESLVRLKKRFGKDFSKFNQMEIQALVTADIEEYVDNARMRQITNCHAADATQLLQVLVSKNALIQKGRGRWTSYYLPFKSDSVHKPSDSVHKIMIHSLHKGEISDIQWNDLLSIAFPARQNKRLYPVEMEQIILKLCRNDWLTRKQLSALVDRNSDGLRSRYLTQMVSHGLLQLRYPDKPNRVDQAYKEASELVKMRKS